ncbi:hypothetical protein ACFPES_16430 [Paenibacillus sp. GCM10023248]|nr:hypothetical protein [Paenibacillus sp. MAHUQ-63]
MIFAYDYGTKDANGEVAPARLVYYYVFYDSEGKISDDGWKIFESTVKWASGMQ